MCYTDGQEIDLGQVVDISLGVSSFKLCSAHWNSGDVVDLDKDQEAEEDEDEDKAHEKIGLVPELDPDALPSAGVQRFLTLICISYWGPAQHATSMFFIFNLKHVTQFVDWNQNKPNVFSVRMAFAKRIAKVAAVRTRFEQAETLTDIQSKLFANK